MKGWALAGRYAILLEWTKDFDTLSEITEQILGDGTKENPGDRRLRTPERSALEQLIMRKEREIRTDLNA